VGSGSSSRQEVVFHNGQFVVEQHSSAADLVPDIATSKRVHGMLQQYFDKCAAAACRFGGKCVTCDIIVCVTCDACHRDAVPRDALLQLLPQLNPSMTPEHFNRMLDQMFAGLKVGGDAGVMTCIQVAHTRVCSSMRAVAGANACAQCLQAVRLVQMPPQPHLSWAHMQVMRARVFVTCVTCVFVAAPCDVDTSATRL
jgi:hypothetical protein